MNYSSCIAVILLCVVSGCQSKATKPTESKPESSRDVSWDFDNGTIRIRELDSHAQILEDWWIGSSVAAFEMEGPQLQFVTTITEEESVLRETFDMAQTLKYKITIVQKFDGDKLAAEFRIVASGTHPQIGGTISRVLKFTQDLNFDGSSGYGINSNFSDVGGLYRIWSAGDATKALRLEAREIQ